MNFSGKQRVLAAANHRATDRVAITFDAEKEVYAALYGHLNVSSKEQLFDFLNCDTWMLLPGGWDSVPIEGTDKKKSIWGFHTTIAQYSGGSYEEICYHPLAGKDALDDIRNWQAPSVADLDFSFYPEQAAKHSDRAVIGVFTHGAYFISTDLRGLQNVMIDFALNKKYAHYLIDKIAEAIFAYLDLMLEKHGDGIDIVYMADDYCSQQGPLFSPSDFREFVFPYLEAVAAKVHKYNKKFLLHCCGAVRPLLPMIIEAGVDMLEPVQIRAEGMEPTGLKRDFGKDLCFYGGIDLQQVLSIGTPVQVADEVRRLIEILGRDGGYVLGPGHTYIQIDCPIENILTMYKTAASHVY